MRFGLPPHVCEFPLVLRGPFYDQTQDARRKSAFHYTNIINLDHRLIPPVYRMEVGGADGPRSRCRWRSRKTGRS